MPNKSRVVRRRLHRRHPPRILQALRARRGDHRHLLAVDRARPARRGALGHPAMVQRHRSADCRGRLRRRRHLPAQLPPPPRGAGGRARRQARHRRKAAVHDARRGRRDDRRVPRARPQADVRRGAVLRAQVRARAQAGGRGRRGRRLHAQAAREALGPAQRLVLGRRAVRRRRADGHGLSRLRVVPLDAGRQPRGEERVGDDGHRASTRAAPSAKTTPSASSSSRAA